MRLCGGKNEAASISYQRSDDLVGLLLSMTAASNKGRSKPVNGHENFLPGPPSYQVTTPKLLRNGQPSPDSYPSQRPSSNPRDVREVVGRYDLSFQAVVPWPYPSRSH
ncbi:hypothetical protein GJ744_001840 [Endocarpon pusillum]|uniref:Uncharacterized protein n=1 Tax=Endocarpon pusillum TaxID=364733 RepID=A0A8H7ASR1_9EURO|nr:hypothetical protein GJ744_001840 [Endocarpon pusillum]